MKNLIRNFYHIVILSALILIANSCYMADVTSAEVLFPSKEVTLSPDIKTFALLNRSYIDQEKRDELAIRYAYGQYYKSKKYRDSIVSDNALYSLAYNLGISPNREIVLNDSIFKMNLADYTYVKPLSLKQINELCAQSGADAIISLEAYHSTDSAYLMAQPDYYLAERKTNTLSVWRIYQKGKPEAVFQSLIEDSLYFNADGYTKRGAANNLLSYDDALYETSYSAGKKFTEQFIPYWDNIDRIYFEHFGKSMIAANAYAQKKQWVKAAQIWRPEAEKEKGITSAIAAYNMAIASELNGQLDLALVWLKKALKLKPTNPYFLNYKKQLRLRISRQKIIDKQLQTN